MSEERSEKPRWLPLESNPAVLTDYVRNIGVPEMWSFRDCFGLTDEALSFVMQPCYALLFLFPLSKIKSERSAEEERLEKEGQLVSDNVFFIKQHVRNACGTIAVVHAIANNMDELKIDSGPLYDFIKGTAKVDASERGHLLGKDERITKYHKESSKKGNTNPKDFVKADFHFICFSMIDSHLYELDGCRKFPINHGPTTRERMLKDAAKVIQSNFIEKNPGELCFSLITLGPAQGDELLPQELLKPRELEESEIDPGKVFELTSMGFTLEQAKFALKKRNNNTQQALEYILRNNDKENTRNDTPLNENLINEITAMGFDREAAIQALKSHQNNLEQALNFLLSG